MAYLYLDESIHDRAGFILVAAVSAEQDLSALVARLVRRTGVDRKEGEFKSSARMASSPAMRCLREALARVVAKHCRLGLVVAPAGARAALGYECVQLLEKLFTMNRWPEGPHPVFIDQEIRVTVPVDPGGNAPEWRKNLILTSGCDSRVVAGIQLADLAAHSLSMILLQALGMAKKILDGAGPDYGYDEEAEIDLGFALWAPWRYSFFAGPLPSAWKLDRPETWSVNVEDYGLHIASSCSPDLRAAVLATFGRCYVGCMH